MRGRRRPEEAPSMERLGRVVAESAMVWHGLLQYQLDRDSSANRVVHFRYCIGFAQKLCYR
jgi:hypothetical protein